MKKLLLILMALTVATISVNAQDRNITRGAVSGELYLSGYWYGIYNPSWGPPVFDTLLKALYHITDHGKKAILSYSADIFIQDEDYPYFDSTVTVPATIIADATPGVLYNKDSRYSSVLSAWLQALWVSFDYGQTWTFREEDQFTKYYYAGSFEGMIYRILWWGSDGKFFRSFDYGLNYEECPMPISLREQGLDICEFWAMSSGPPDYITHTTDCGQTYDYMLMDSQYFHGGIGYGIAADIYRGALPGEVYVSSWFPDWTYKISFSADTGRTFRVVYHSDSLYFANDQKILKFMSDREAGVFYIVYGELVEIDEPWGIYEKICISHYRDYGETLVGTYCHDFMIGYPESCAGVLDMEAEVWNNNNVLLQWSPPEGEQTVAAYRIYRDNVLLAELQQTTCLDEDLPDGSYTYYIRAMYSDSCESLSYNIVKVNVEFITGIEAPQVPPRRDVRVYPNPTDGMLYITTVETGHAPSLQITNIEIFDVFGRAVVVAPIETLRAMSLQSHIAHRTSQIEMDISHLPTGMYFVRIQTENDAITKKIMKR